MSLSGWCSASRNLASLRISWHAFRTPSLSASKGAVSMISSTTSGNGSNFTIQRTGQSPPLSAEPLGSDGSGHSWQQLNSGGHTR